VVGTGAPAATPADAPTAAPDEAAERRDIARGLRLAVFTDTYAPQVNGVARTLERLAEAVRRRGGAVRVVTTGDPSARADPDVVRWPSVPFWGDPHVRIAPPLLSRARRELLAWHPTVVLAATPFGVGIAGRAAARGLGTRLVTSYHTHLSAYARFYGLGALEPASWRFLRWFHGGGMRTYCPTRAVGDELARRGFHDLALWSRGVEHARFHPGHRSRARRLAFGAREDTVLVIYAGRLAREKNLEVALKAMRVADAALPGRFAFALAGDGPFAARARAQAPSGATFTGRITGDALSAFYAAGDVMLFPSTTDTFGNVLLEGMASGTAVVAADAPPTREILGDGGGVLVAPDDASAMAGELVTLALDGARRRALQSAALAASARFNWDGVFDAFLSDLRALP